MTISSLEEARVKGNEAFARGEWEEAIKIYEEGLTIEKNDEGMEVEEEGDSEPQTKIARLDGMRYILLANIAAAKIKMKKWEEAVSAATRAIEEGAVNEKALERRAYAYSNMDDKLDSALEDYNKLIEQYPHRRDLQEKVKELQPRIHERNEKLKAEMMGKLKSFGDFCLRPFGLSTNSFEMTPNGQGGYSLNMKQSNNQQE